MIIIDVPTIMKKRTKTMIEKICEICGKKYLGSEKPNSSKICRSCVQKNANNKRRSTMIKKYGVDNVMKLPNAYEKFVKAGFNKKYGKNINSAMDIPEAREKFKHTMMERYGVHYYIQTDEWKSNANFKISKINKSISNFLQANGYQCELEFNIEDKLYDIHIMNTNILIEIDPSYTHSVVANHWNKHGIEEKYHVEKSILAEIHGYRCIHIFDWDNWKDDILQLIKNPTPNSGESILTLDRSKYSYNDYSKLGYIPIEFTPVKLHYSSGSHEISGTEYEKLRDDEKFKYLPVYDCGHVIIKKSDVDIPVIDNTLNEAIFSNKEMYEKNEENRRIKNKERACKFCGKIFIPKSNNQWYCKNVHIRICPVCGKNYIEDNVENLKRPPVACSYECRKVRREQTSLKKYGRKDPGNNPNARKKAKETMKQKFGVDYAMQSQKIQEKSRNTYKMNHKNKRLFSSNQTIEIPENENDKGSKITQRVAKKLNDVGLETSFEFKLDTKFYDIHILGTNTLIEIDPTYTHNIIGNHLGDTGVDKYYHRDKSKLAEKYDYRCIHIFDWDDLDKIVDMLKPRKKIYARNCSIYKINKDIGDKFLNSYHLQGTCKGQLLYLGLVYQNELLELMTFGKPRYNKNYPVELLRLCTKSGYSVIGGASKLFKYVVNVYELDSILSYCDISKFDGSVYEKLGMKYHHATPPQEIWSKRSDKITANLLRQRGFDQLFGTNYGKGTDNNELMIEHGWLPVYDCGQKVFVYE